MKAGLKRILVLSVFGTQAIQADESLSKFEKDYQNFCRLRFIKTYHIIAHVSVEVYESLTDGLSQTMFMIK